MSDSFKKIDFLATRKIINLKIKAQKNYKNLHYMYKIKLSSNSTVFPKFKKIFKKFF